MKRKKYASPKEALEALKQYVDTKREIPTHTIIKKDASLPSSRYLQKNFGGLCNALEQLGISKNYYKGKKMDQMEYEKKIEIKETINDFISKHGKSPTYLEYMGFARENGKHTSVRDYYLTWNDALADAGASTRATSYSKEELLSILIDLSNKLKRAPRACDMGSKNGLPSAPTFKKAFGSWNNALRAAEHEVNQHEPYSEEDIKNEIFRFINEHEGRCPGLAEFDGINYKPHASIIARRYNGWKNAIRYITKKPYIEQGKYGIPGISNHNHIRPSCLECMVDNLLGHLGIYHNHDVKYKKHIPNLKNSYEVDSFVFTHDGFIFIEVAGMISEKQYNSSHGVLGKKEQSYSKRLHDKVDICSENGIELVVIFKNYKKRRICKMLESINERAVHKGPIYEGDGIISHNPKRMNHHNKQKFSDNALLENINCKYKELGRLPYLFEMEDKRFPYQSIYTKRKKWNEWITLFINTYGITLTELEIRKRKLNTISNPEVNSSKDTSQEDEEQ